MRKAIVEVREYERGWGSRVEDVIEFDTNAQAEAYCKEYNKDNNLPQVPDWYMVALIVQQGDK